MCGIAGFVGGGNEKTLRDMIEIIRHRGPDDLGVYYSDPIGLAHARLSIIDESLRGHQPMWNEHKDVAIVFNGEIYNFKALKKEFDLEKKYQFQSETDTEVLLHLYEELGEQCFEKLGGMFAIAIFDSAKQKLLLARDRIGEKPLYWSLQKNNFVFASELGAVISSGLIEKEIDLSSLDKYLLFDYVPTPHTILKNIYKLEPATYLVFENGSIRKQAFWSPPKTIASLHERDVIDRLDSLLNKSVSSQLVSDVPLGVFLSGGIDSSVIAWYAQKNSKDPIDTFSIGFEDSDFDESRHAKEVASFLGTRHHEYIVTPNDALSLITQIPEVFSEPVSDASVIPTLILSQFTRKEVKVALGGDGGDELFAGYPTFHAENILSSVPSWLAQLMRAGIRSAVKFLPSSDGNFSLSFNLKKFISSDKEDREYRHMEWLGSFPEKERKLLVLGSLRSATQKNNIFEDIDRYKIEYKQPDPLNRLLYVYLRSYLMDQVLVKVDRASMRHALEVRVPFLDHTLVTFLFSLPYYLKYKKFQTKYLLKKLMRGRLPDSILDRKKKGFGIPLSRWLKGELKDLCNDLLSSEKINEQGFFNPEYVAKLKADHFEGKADNRKQLWNIMVFQMWYRYWIK